MKTMPGASALAVAAALLSQCGTPELALAQNKPVGSLAPHGTPASADLIPIQPTGSTTLQASYASDVQNYVLTSLNGFPGVDPTGVTDSTAGIQAAINSGARLSCNGVYKISSTLTLNTAASQGQLITGGGSSNQGASVTAGRCIFRPSSSMSGFAFVVDGTPISTYMMGVAFENLTVDLTNVTDVSTNGAFNQIQAFDDHYSNVRVTNDGLNKRSWLFNFGAFTTTLKDTQGNILDFEGTGAGEATTTITVINHDGFRVISNWGNGLKFIGGAYQGSGVHFSFTNTNDVEISTDVEGSGTYLSLSGTNNSYIRSFAELEGMSTGFTEVSGSCAYDCIIWDQLNSFATYSKDLTYGSLVLNNQGAAGFSRFLSGAAGADYYIGLGRTGLDSLWGVAASANDIVSGTVAGDTVFESYPASGAIWLSPNQGAGSGYAKITATGFYSYGAGTINEATSNTGYTTATAIVVKPPIDGQMLTLETAAGTGYMVCTSSVMIANSSCAVDNGADWRGFSDNGITQTYDFNSSNGSAFFTGTLNAAGYQVSGRALVIATAPTYLSGFSVGAPTITGSATSAFTVTLGTTPASTGVLTMPSSLVSTGWNCISQDRTTAAGTIRETATTTSTVTFSLSGTVANDLLQFECLAF